MLLKINVRGLYQMNFLSMLLAETNKLGGVWAYFPIFRLIACIFIFLCALFVIAVVVIQPGNSTGVSPLTGSSETFLSKNKGKTLESKLKKLTVIASCILGVCCILMVVLSFIAG